MIHPLLQTYGPLDGWMILLIMASVSIGFFHLPSTESHATGSDRFT